ncbi:hypothetical protein MN608_09919 [Microdochium nivale]|nr:hypothetical protein MN608_09919 [Microdochium nivale]
MDNTTNAPWDLVGGFLDQTDNHSQGHSTPHDNHDNHDASRGRPYRDLPVTQDNVGTSPRLELAQIGTQFGVQYPDLFGIQDWDFNNAHPGWNTNNLELSLPTSQGTHSTGDPNLAADFDNIHEIELGSIRQPVNLIHSATSHRAEQPWARNSDRIATSPPIWSWRSGAISDVVIGVAPAVLSVQSSPNHGNIPFGTERAPAAIEQFNNDSANAAALVELQRNTHPPLPLPNSPTWVAAIEHDSGHENVMSAFPLLTTQNLFSRIPASCSTRSEPVTGATQTINDPEALSANSQHRRLACPYYKLDSFKHKDCVKFEFARIKDVKQHLKRKHINQHGITEAQKEELKRHATRGTGQYAQWFAIWNVLFPDPQPNSPYTLGLYDEIAKQIRLNCHKHLQLLTSHVLASPRAAGVFTPGGEQILPELLKEYTDDLLGTWRQDLTAATSYSAPSEPDDTAQSSTGKPKTSLPTLVSAPSVAPTDDMPEEPSSMWRCPPHASQPQHLGLILQSEGDGTSQYSNLVTSTGTRGATPHFVRALSSPRNRHSPGDFINFDFEQYEPLADLVNDEKSHFSEAIWTDFTNL